MKAKKPNPAWIVIEDTETNRQLQIIDWGQRECYVCLNKAEVGFIPRRSIGKKIREFMKEVSK